MGRAANRVGIVANKATTRARDFLRVGAIAMPPALILALGALIFTGE